MWCRIYFVLKITNMPVNKESIIHLSPIKPELLIPNCRTFHWSIKLPIERRCSVQPSRILCSSTLHSLLCEMHEHMLSYCLVLASPGAPVRSVPAQVLELPLPESKFNWAEFWRHFAWHHSLSYGTHRCLCAKSNYLILLKGTRLHQEIIKSVVVLSQARAKDMKL